MIKVGLTGNIGSGKTTVSQIFSVLGVPIYHADIEARKFYNQPEVIGEITDAFGDGVLEGKGISRKKLAAIVFSDRNKLDILNSIIHPRVKNDLNYWLKQMDSETYIVQEAAILFESGFYRDFDKVIMVNSPKELAIQRVMKRDGISRSEIQQRIKHQWNSEKKIKLSDFLITNDEKQMLIPQVIKIHQHLLNLHKIGGE